MKLTRKEKAKVLIERAGLRNWQVADLVGVREDSFSRWFRYGDITGEQLERIATACKKAGDENDRG